MPVIPFPHLACPLDGEPLHCEEHSWRCGNGHSFDIARQGYTHLLPVQNKRSRDPGDSKEMVAARQRFLASGAYQPIANAVNRLTLAHWPLQTTLHCLDAGCGEGYYLRQLAAAALQQQQPGQRLALLGLDISKWAVLAAARQQHSCRWVVGSNANLPVIPGTLDRVLCMFGFADYGEFARVLKTTGELLQVDAGDNHLRELREIIYPGIRSPRSGKRQTPAGFTPLSTETLSYPLQLQTPQQITDLLAMTPHWHRTSTEGRARLSALSALTVTVDIRLTRYGRIMP